MIFLFGTKVFQKQLPSEQKVCPNCISVTEHTVVEHDTRLTFYFIPLLSVKREVTYTCLTCGDSHTVDYADYQAAHREAQPVSEKAAHQSGPAPKVGPRTSQEKARAILEGRIVNGEVKTSRPMSANFSSDQILKYFYIIFAVVAVVAITLLVILLAALTR
jgi:hypothetical protein